MAEEKIFGLVVGLQEAEIKHWCFDRCKDILVGGLKDEQMGEMAVCKTVECAHEDSNVELGTCADGVVYVRTLIGCHTETIWCPECETVQPAVVEHTVPWFTYVHECVHCGYMITESEWNVVIEG